MYLHVNIVKNMLTQELINQKCFQFTFSSSLTLTMKGLLVSLIFIVSLEQVFTCDSMIRCLDPTGCYKKGTSQPQPRVWQLDTQPGDRGCHKDVDGNQWCKFWADPKGCFRNGEGSQWCFTKVPVKAPSQPQNPFTVPTFLPVE